MRGLDTKRENPNVSREEYGSCNICMKEAKLTWDHVPPKARYSITPAIQQTLFQNMSSRSGNVRLFSETQNSVKFRTLCSSCNNSFLGKNFAEQHQWRLDSRSARTFCGPILEIEYELQSFSLNSKYRKIYRNPIIYAQELQEEMRREGLTQSELARKHGISRARVSQWLSLLKLPKIKIERVIAMGDHWEWRLLTERGLRRRSKEKRNL